MVSLFDITFQRNLLTSGQVSCFKTTAKEIWKILQEDGTRLRTLRLIDCVGLGAIYWRPFTEEETNSICIDHRDIKTDKFIVWETNLTVFIMIRGETTGGGGGSQPISVLSDKLVFCLINMSSTKYFLWQWGEKGRSRIFVHSKLYLWNFCAR